MLKYSDDDFVEFIPASDIIPDNSHAKRISNIKNEPTSNINMALQNQQPVIQSAEETNCYTMNIPSEDNDARFQISYCILRDPLPAIIVFQCSGKLVESNCLVLHNTFKMCSAKNLPFIIFDMTDVLAVEKEVWVYFSSKVAKLQKLNGILLFAGIRSEVLSETTDFNKLNICHCDTVATCCLAIRNLTHDHEKTDSCLIVDEDDSSIETQSNIHDFLYNERPASELPEMKLVDDLLNRKKNEMICEKPSEELKKKIISSAQSQPKPDFSPFDQTILINSDDSSNPIAEAKRKVMAELNGEMPNEELKKHVGSSVQSQSQPKSDFSPIEKTILINSDDSSNPIAEAKRKVMAELNGEMPDEELKEPVGSPIQSQSQTKPELFPIEKVNLNSPGLFEKTILLDDEHGSPILDAKKKVLEELGKSPKTDERRKDETGSNKATVRGNKLPASQPESKPVVSDNSQILSLKDLYIDDSMSTDYSIVEKNQETPQEYTDSEMLPLIDESQSIDFSQNDKTVMSQSATVDMSRSSLGLTQTNISLKNISPSDPYSVHYGVYEKKAEEKTQALPATKSEKEKLTAQELIFRVIADYGPVNILQLKTHINEKLDKKDRINTFKLFALLRQVDLDTHDKRVRYYRSC